MPARVSAMPPLALVSLALLTVFPAQADSEIDALRAEITTLTQRLAQIEVHKFAVGVGEEDVEKAGANLRGPGRLEADVDGLAVGASLTMVGQKASDRDGQLTLRADIEIELPRGSIGDAEGKLFAHVRAGDGAGVEAGSFGGVNATAAAFPPSLMQAYYRLNIPVGGESGQLDQIEVVVGKMDMYGQFDGNTVADDETEAFLNAAFVHNPLLDAGGAYNPASTDGSSPGLKLAYVTDINGRAHLTASVGVFGAGNGAKFDNSFSQPFTIAQLEYAGQTWQAGRRVPWVHVA